jgi:hypothetical protein
VDISDLTVCVVLCCVVLNIFTTSFPKLCKFFTVLCSINDYVCLCILF